MRALALVALWPVVLVGQQAPATAPATLTPPVAAVRPHRFDEHGTVRIDNYYWLKDRKNPEVIRYLEDENAYTKAVMAHTEPLQERLYEELKGRVQQNDQSVPFREGNFEIDLPASNEDSRSRFYAADGWKKSVATSQSTPKSP